MHHLVCTLTALPEDENHSKGTLIGKNIMSPRLREFQRCRKH